MYSRAFVLAVTLCLTVAWTLAVGIPVVAAAADTPDDPKPLDSCFDDANDPSPSRTYVLTQDIDATHLGPNQDCFSFDFSGTVIEGNGHAIRGNGNGTGIELDVDGAEIRNVTVTGFETGIHLLDSNRLEIYDSTVANNSGAGVRDDGDSGVEIWRSTIADNGVGVSVGPSSYFWVEESRIVDNEGFGLSSRFGVVRWSVIAGNGGDGVHVNPDVPPNFSFVDARYNYWGAADGPSSDPAHPPLADPDTGALANGSGDQVSPHFDIHPPANTTPPRPNVSNVRFDPYLTAPLGEGETVYDGHYQVDLVGGDPIPQLSADRLYSDERRLVGFLHGQGEDVERTGTPPTLSPNLANCIDVASWSVENGTAAVEFTVAADCRPIEMTLVAYEKPSAGFSRATADQQRLHDLEGSSFGPGTHVVQVTLPEASATDSDESTSLAAPSTGRSSALTVG